MSSFGFFLSEPKDGGGSSKRWSSLGDKGAQQVQVPQRGQWPRTLLQMSPHLQAG